MEAWSVHHLFESAEPKLGTEAAAGLQSYAQRLIDADLPVIFSLGHLAKITGTSYRVLRDTVNRKRESANYKMFAVRKRSGGRRFIHSVSGKLDPVLHFLNVAILQKIPVHPCSFAFHRSGGIRRCAAVHCGARWLFQYDLSDFFYDITEADVFQIFARAGYRRLLAFELARLCTTTHVPKCFRLSYVARDTHSARLPYHAYGVAGVLPQGSPTSPMLSNLAAVHLDEVFSAFATDHGFVYTRYADDLTLSATHLPKDTTIGLIHTQVVHIIRSCGFRENSKKTRIAGPGSKKVVLGLLADGDKPRVSREMYHRIDRHLYAAAKFGVVETARHEGFDSAYGFYNHLSGLIAYTKDVDKKRWEKFAERFSGIEPPIT